MVKTFKVNEKKLTYRYNKRLLLLNIPALAIVASILIIVYLILNRQGTPLILYRAVFYTLNGALAYSFFTCFIGSVIASAKIKGHKNNTYIEILNSDMVVSQHMHSYIINGRIVDYKKLWVINLKDIESASYYKGIITITGPARLFYENSDWLKYDCDDRGISFKHWWYNDNGGKNVQTVEFKDYYTYGKSIVKRILYCQRKYYEREQRRQRFREEMLTIAASTTRPSRISLKYVPKKKNPF